MLLKHCPFSSIGCPLCFLYNQIYLVNACKLDSEENCFYFYVESVAFLSENNLLSDSHSGFWALDSSTFQLLSTEHNGDHMCEEMSHISAEYFPITD